MADSYIDKLELAEHMVADWAVEAVNRIYKILTPDGRPYGYTEQDMDGRLVDYMALRGNEQAWGQYILDSAQNIAQKLIDSGLDQATMLSVHPWDIAAKYAAEYSIEMEDELRRRAKKNGNLAVAS